MQLIILAFVVLMWSLIPGLAQDKSATTPAQGTAGNIAETNRGPDCVKVALFFGGGAKGTAGRKVSEMTGETPYKPDQVVSMEELRERAANAVKREATKSITNILVRRTSR